ncbi:uncharacterized protein BXZ73DRAFT_91561 [Epithele typhae]|uniref:uncharacterized protein n=1 Tax=Epithele typhae TaxID=378194 RepID=UPI0020073C35|nr:uncharacterized protein BXZ73DRAFT_91561 [Epithele typhae]KAH9922848.1 hypothetical protein BXZ73DRAFT_91561 [Epithele typhae]
MSRPHHQLLKQLCHDENLFKKAKETLHTASLKTGPGSGYVLGDGGSGLPAICAFLTAQDIGDTDLSEKVAQNASCLKPRVWKTTLAIVRSALEAAAAAEAASKKAARTVTYQALAVQHRLGRKDVVVKWMQEAERALMSNTEVRRRHGSAYDAITLAVFSWTCEQIGPQTAKKVDTPSLLAQYAVPQDQFDEITEALLTSCKAVEKLIKDNIKALKADSSSPAKARVARASSSKVAAAPPAAPFPTAPSRQASESSIREPAATPRSPTKSPTKSALRASSVGLTTQTPTHKRKVAFEGPIAEEEEEEEDFDATATPSKRRKLFSPTKSSAGLPLTPRTSSRIASRVAAGDDDRASQASPSTPRRARTTAQPSSTHSSRSRMSTGSAPSTPTKHTKLATVLEQAGPRRCRPVFADQQQWLKGDARLERELRPWAEKWRELVRSADGNVWKAAGMA